MILGLTGTLGAGKAWTSNYIKQHYDFILISLSDFIRDELRKKGIEDDMNSLFKMGNELRARYGAGCLAEKALEFKKKNKIKNLIVRSVRHPKEVEILRSSGEKFHLIKVDGPLELRWERYNSHVSEEGQLSLEEFIRFENSQMEGSKYHQQLRKCMEMADGTIFNDGNLRSLAGQIEEEIYQFIDEF